MKISSPNIRAFFVIVLLMSIVLTLGILIERKLPAMLIKEEMNVQKNNLQEFLSSPINHPLYRRMDSLCRLRGDVISLALKNNDKDGLLKYMKPVFLSLKQEYPTLEVINIITKDGDDFLRLTKPELSNGNILYRRPLLKKVLETKSKIVGFECGYEGCYYRVAAPIVREGELMGVIEMGMALSYIEKTLINIMKNTAIVTFLNTNIPKERIPSPPNPNNPHFGHYVTCDICMSTPIAKLLPKLLPDEEGLHRLHAKDKEYVYESTDATNILDIDGNILGKVLLFIDTERIIREFNKGFEKDLLIALPLVILFSILGYFYLVRHLNYIKELQAQAYRNKKEIAINELLTNIAHQWRQPLTVISLAAQNAIEEIEDCGDKEMIKKRMETVINSAKNITEVITQFTNIHSSYKYVKEEPINLETLLKNIVSDKASETKIPISFRLEQQKEVIIDAKRAPLEKVLNEIIQNSIDAALRNGMDKIDIEAWLEVLKNGVKISIKDRSGGVKEDILERIFEPYITSEFKSKDKGLGMYLVRHLIAEVLKGEIECKNSNGGLLSEIVIPTV